MKFHSPSATLTHSNDRPVMIPSAVYNYLVNNDYTSMDQFYGKEQAYLTIDVV